MRTLGVEEELLLINEQTGRPSAVSRQLLRRYERSGADTRLSPAPGLTSEMQQEMIEVVSTPHSMLSDLLTDIRDGRALADRYARGAGARAVALASCPVAVSPHPNEKKRYQVMMRRYGTTARKSLSCGQHVHVSIDSPEEGVAILDRIRVWLPVLIALSANSPFCEGEDTGYASFRSVTWRQWPSAGPTDVFGSLAAYQAHEEQLLQTGALLDAGMLYFDARLSHNHPTVEIRVADVCLEATAAATIAGLVRAMAETAAAEWRAGVPAPSVSSAAIRLSTWTAARFGLRGELVNPESGTPDSAGAVVRALIEHVREPLVNAGDLAFVWAGVQRLLAGGTGADWQRRARTTGSLEDVASRALELTHGRGHERTGSSVSPARASR
jgi:carboxylate-amine ligase